MGVNSKTSHATYPVATTIASPVTPDPQPGPAAPTVTQPELATLTGLVLAPDPAGHYDQVLETVADAKAAGADHAALTELTSTYLHQLTPAELQQLAAEHGFAHPALVGLSGTTPHPLAHWLDPAYPPGCASKQKIQAVAQARYDALAAGHAIAGHTIDDIAASPPGPAQPGQWAATPEQFTTAQADLAELVAALPKHGPLSGDQVTGLVAAENHLATAACPQLGTATDQAKSAARHLVDTATSNVCALSQVKPAVAEAVAAGRLTDTEARLLDTRQQLALLRRSTPAEQRAELHETAVMRNAQLDALTTAHASYLEHVQHGTITHTGETTADQVAGLAAAAGALHQARAAVVAWSSYAGSGHEIQTSEAMVTAQASAYKLSGTFRGWAKSQKLATLRDAAAATGLEHAPKATRAQVQNYLIAAWDSSQSKQQIQAAVTAATTTPKLSPPKPKPAGDAATGSRAPAGSGGWVSGQQQLLAALQHAAASSAALPPRHADTEVASWTFAAASVGPLGGSHTKSVHAAPDGSMWMFKPDTSTGGARAHAEATASKALAAVGLPSIPVYTKTIGGNTGSLQPLMPGAKDLSPDPGTWSQPDVDAIVRYHVAAWAIGDHDGKPSNVLRTPGGGLVPIDQGAAFKYWGSDKLSMSYQPLTAPVFHLAYQAHKNGTLPAGVTIKPSAAHSVLKAFEAMPDTQWRDLLHTTAHQGAARNVSWAPKMRTRAAKRLGVPETAVSTDQVAAEFLDHAVARKGSLRADFAKFFDRELGLANALAAVAARV